MHDLLFEQELVAINILHAINSPSNDLAEVVGSLNHAIGLLGLCIRNYAIFIGR